MCGVIGIFNFQYSNIIILELINSLKKLQNRGRDSYGILLLNNSDNFLYKSPILINLDKVKELKLRLLLKIRHFIIKISFTMI